MYESLASLPSGTYTCSFVRVFKRKGAVYANVKIGDRFYSTMIGRVYGGETFVEKVRRTPRRVKNGKGS